MLTTSEQSAVAAKMHTFAVSSALNVDGDMTAARCVFMNLEHVVSNVIAKSKKLKELRRESSEKSTLFSFSFRYETFLAKISMSSCFYDSISFSIS